VIFIKRERKRKIETKYPQDLERTEYKIFHPLGKRYNELMRFAT
jgi:hypothetical protein